MEEQTNNFIDGCCLTVDELLAREFDSEPLIGDGILDSEGLLVLQGATESGKSYLALQMALELATGKPFLGRFTIEAPQRVMLIQAEIGEKQFQKRVRKLTAGLPTTGDMLRLCTSYRTKLDGDEGKAEVDELLRLYPTDVLILDPMRPFHDGDENSSQEMERFFSGLRWLQERHGVAVVIAHHERKPSNDQNASQRKIADARGSSLITDRPDTVLSLTKRPAGRYELRFEKLRNNDEVEKPGLLNLAVGANGLFTITGGADDEAKVKQGDVLALLPEDGSAVSLRDVMGELVASTGASDKTVRHRINGMEDQGLVERLQDPAGKTMKLIRRVKAEVEKGKPPLYIDNFRGSISAN